jgi:Transposase
LPSSVSRDLTEASRFRRGEFFDSQAVSLWELTDAPLRTMRRSMGPDNEPVAGPAWHRWGDWPTRGRLKARNRSHEVIRLGHRPDQDAVNAALTEPWTNGQTEGQNREVKLVKRQMYGPDGLDLLEERLLAAV